MPECQLIRHFPNCFQIKSPPSLVLPKDRKLPHQVQPIDLVPAKLMLLLLARSKNL